MTAGWPLAAGPYYFLGPRPLLEAECVAYIRREHARGRRLADVLGDPYLSRRLGRDVRRLLRRPELIRALGENDAGAIRGAGAELERLTQERRRAARRGATVDAEHHDVI